MLGAAAPRKKSASVLLDASHGDDAGAVRLEGGRALLHTVDVITPIVDDPATFGRIAAANAVSDIFAMGGEPTSAVSILAVPKGLPRAALDPMLAGAREALEACGAHLVGGHTLKDDELKLGFAVTGVADARRLATHSGARPGDLLILTKPLGTGLLHQAARQQGLSRSTARAWVESMARPNRDAAALVRDLRARAATDVTGFGFGGHAAHLARASAVDVVVDPARLPRLPGVDAALEAGVSVGPCAVNLRAYRAHLRFGRCPEPVRRLVGDPQTSGGLLFAVAPGKRRRLPGEGAWVVGRVEAPAATRPSVRFRHLGEL
jgi:selenide,water dikinase